MLSNVIRVLILYHFLKILQSFEATAIHCDNQNEKTQYCEKNGSGNIMVFHNMMVFDVRHIFRRNGLFEAWIVINN